ncbi:MAG: hypothetical protein M0P10_03475 [Sphaerochaetaceae bacterium]|nr:hypothetical protein [Sphaerochaetaceae bacterium]
MRLLNRAVFIFAFVFVFNLFSLYAADSGTLDVSIFVDVPVEPYYPTIYYNDQVLALQNRVLDDNEQPFSITEDGETPNFIIRIEGNEGSSKILDVSIDGNYFLSTENNNFNNSGVFAYPSFIEEGGRSQRSEFVSYVVQIPYGPHDENKNSLEKAFLLSWEGNSDLPSGFYSCSIGVIYSVVN